MHGAARLDRVFNEGMQGDSGGSGNACHPDPSDPPSIFFGRNDHQCLGSDVASIVVGARSLSANVSFVHFHAAPKSVTAWANHRPAELVQPGPGGQVTSQPQDLLEVNR